MNATAIQSKKASAPTIEQEALAVRDHKTWSPGDAAHQGDIILICLRELPPKSKVRKNRQIADGDTVGSRHVLVGGNVYDADPGTVAKMVEEATGGRVKVGEKYVGPVFAGPAVLEHPQHQHQSFPDETVTVCVFQRNQTAEEQEIRALD